jgi:hypothetical protein
MSREPAMTRPKNKAASRQPQPRMVGTSSRQASSALHSGSRCRASATAWPSSRTVGSQLVGGASMGGRPARRSTPKGPASRNPRSSWTRPGAAVDDRVQQGVGAEDGELVGGELLGKVVLGHGGLWWLLPAGRALLLARPGATGCLRAASAPERSRGRRRRSEHSGARRRRGGSPTGRQPAGPRGCRVPARGTAGEAGPCPQPPRWVGVELPVGWWWPPEADCGAVLGPGPADWAGLP